METLASSTFLTLVPVIGSNTPSTKVRGVSFVGSPLDDVNFNTLTSYVAIISRNLLAAKTFTR
jgi:hypothetical protein